MSGAYILVPCLPDGSLGFSKTLLAPVSWPCPLNPLTSWFHPWEQPDSGAAAAALTFSSSSVTSFLELEQVTSFLGTELGSQGEGVSATERGKGGLDALLPAAVQVTRLLLGVESHRHQ